MNRSWITALTLASVIGTGGAFVGVITASNERPVAASPEPTALPSAALVDLTTPHLDPAGTVAYRLDSVGTVTVQVANGGLTVLSNVADPGWTAIAASGHGTHIEASFTDAAQLVTFTADLSGGNVAVSVSNVAVTTAAQPAPPTRSATTKPAGTSPATTELEPTVPDARPAAPQTTTPSTAGGDDGVYDDHGTGPNDD